MIFPLSRRRFLSLAAGVAGVGCFRAWARDARVARTYSVVLLGDTHFDSVDTGHYHADYLFSTSEKRYRAHLREHVRNAEMWRARMPALLKASAASLRGDEAFILQLGDLVQGDCGNTATQRRMLSDAVDAIKGAYGGRLPFVTVVGNHDIRGDHRNDDARKAFDAWQAQLMSRELRVPVADTTFSFRNGPDAYIVVDFNEPRPNLDKVAKLLEACDGARYVFLISHGPFIPNGRHRWNLFGSKKRSRERRELMRLLAKRNAIVLAGHTHRVELYDCELPEGRITQFVANSVWAKPEQAAMTALDTRADQYGRQTRDACKGRTDSRLFKELSGYTAEFAPYMKRYFFANAAGHYAMEVSDAGVKVRFYGGSATSPARTFVLR